MSAIFDPGKAARKARKRARRDEKEEEREREKREARLLQARSDQRAALLGGRAESTQTSILGG